MRLAFDARCEAEARSSFARVLQLLRKAAEEVSIPIENWRHGECTADVIWSPNSTLPKLKGIKKVATIHDINPLLEDGRVGWKRALRKRQFREKVRSVIQNADRIATVSEFSKSCLEKEFPAIRPLLNVVPNYPAPQFHSSIQPASLQELNLPPNRILFLAALRRHKGWDTLVRAWCQLPKGVREAHPLVLAGSNKRVGNKPFQIAATKGVTNEGIFLPGSIPDSLLPSLFQSAKVFVFPSLAEGFGLPPLEAMACGTPVIAAHSTSLPEVLGNACLWFRPGNAMELAERILEIIQLPDSKQISKIGVAQAKLWSAKKTGEAMLKTLEQLHS